MKRFDSFQKRFVVRLALLLCVACATTSTKTDGDGGGAGNTGADGGTSDAGADGGILDVVFVFHLEGWDNGDSSQFDVYKTKIRELMNIWEDAGAKISFETESVVTGVKESLVQGIQLHGGNIFTEMNSRGHTAQLHGGGQMGLESTYSAFLTDLNDQRALLQDAGVNPVSVSNICSSMDWTTAVASTGYSFVTSLVEYCAKSLPIEKQSASTQACSSPDTCHGNYPFNLDDRLRPWRASGPDWITPNPDGGLVILPSAYVLSCIAEDRASDGGANTGCAIDSNDVTAYQDVLNYALARTAPGVVTTFAVVSSFGGHPTSQEYPYVGQMLQAARAFVGQGRVRFSTTVEVYNYFRATQ